MTFSHELPRDPALRSKTGKDAQVPVNSAASASAHTEHSVILYQCCLPVLPSESGVTDPPHDHLFCRVSSR